MNKYDFDFKSIENILQDVLGITNSTDIQSLKLQIHDCLNSLSESIDRKAAISPTSNPVKTEVQKKALKRELYEIEGETDLEKILKKCIVTKYMTLLSLEVKIRPGDSLDDRVKKNLRRKEIFAVSELSRSVPSIIELMKKRRVALNYIDSDNRIIDFNRTPYDNNLNSSQSQETNLYPSQKLSINFMKKPMAPVGELNRVLQDAGIYVYNFGDVTYSRYPNDEGRYTQELNSKNLVGVIKKDEFGALRKYAILMNDVLGSLPPEFCRDVLFSDMLLRNAKNNMGFLGVAERDFEDKKFGYKVIFDEIGLKEMLSAINFENDQSRVLVSSNFKRVQSVNDAFMIMEEKLEQAIREVSEAKAENKYNREVGDDD